MNATSAQEIIKTQKPLDRMLDAFPGAHQRNNGWWTHNDNPRFDFLESPEGNIRIKSWTGRTVDDILAMGQVQLTRAALYAKQGQESAVQSRDKIDLFVLAEYMCIDWQWVMREGYSDGYTYTSHDGRTTRCIKLGGICTPDGQENTKHQVRLSLHKEPRFLWDQNTPGEMLPSGLHYLDRARSAGYLIAGEGNSDWATMTFHGIPFIGIPGADQAKTLDVELVKDIPVIYLIEEPDQVKKLRETGQGFYKNMRQHLRGNGYTGEIFSIRFMDATGYKDPSDLHKAIYASCKEQSEGPFRQEVHKHFIEAIEQAIGQAIPEGNTELFPVAHSRDWSQITFEEFYKQVWAVSPEYLSPLQKGIVCYLFLYMRQVEPDETGLGWKIDANIIAPAVGLRGPSGKKKVLAEIAYLYQKVGILNKEHRAIKEYVGDEDGPEQVRYRGTTLYIQPRPSFYTPRGYCVVTEDQHKSGGPRMAVDKCELCGSRHLKHYAVQCVDCGHVMYPPIEPDDPLPLEKVIESTLRKQAIVPTLEESDNQSSKKAVTPVVTNVPFEPNKQEEEENPEHLNLRCSGNEQELRNIDSVTAPQIEVLGNPLPSLVSPLPFSENGLPRRLTLCCNVPFQRGPDGWPECSNPQCPEKQRREAH